VQYVIAEEFERLRIPARTLLSKIPMLYKPMRKLNKQISLNDVKAGDVLLFRKADKSKAETDISVASGSEYTHAAICIGDGKAAGAGLRGIAVEPLEELLGMYDHVAVFRQPDAWSPQRLNALADFAAAAVAAKKRYNFDGLREFIAIRETHESTVHERLSKFFSGTYEPPTPTAADHYTCSEFVAAAYIIIGFIRPSAAIAYSPAPSPPAISEKIRHTVRSSAMLPLSQATKFRPTTSFITRRRSTNCSVTKCMVAPHRRIELPCIRTLNGSSNPVKIRHFLHN
jgi:hypothetical protein